MWNTILKPASGAIAGFTMPRRGDPGVSVPQVQDPWGRSPSDPAYGQPPPGGAPGMQQPVPYDEGPGLQPMPGGGEIPGPSTMPTLPDAGWGRPMPQPSQAPGFGGITTQRPANNGASLYALGGGAPPWGGTSWLKPSVAQGFASPLGSFIRR